MQDNNNFLSQANEYSLRNSISYASFMCIFPFCILPMKQQFVITTDMEFYRRQKKLDQSLLDPSHLYSGYRVFTGGKSGRGVMLTPHPLLVPWSKKSRAIPVHPVWAVHPVQRLSACTVQLYLYSPYGSYSLYRASVPVQ